MIMLEVLITVCIIGFACLSFYVANVTEWKDE